MNSPITIDALKVLDAIDRKKSFAAAADELFRVPSAISYTINKLEEDLDVAIFDRSKRKAELTPVGRMLLDHGRAILKATDELTHLTKQVASGWESELRICIDSILHYEPIYNLINEFQKAHGWINIKVTEEVLGGTWDALVSGNTDLIIGATDVPSDSDIVSKHIGEIDFVFAVSKGHPLTNVDQPIPTPLVKKYPSVVVADSSKTLPTRSIGLLDGQSRITVPTIEKKIEAQLLGLGVGFLPLNRISDLLASGELVDLQLTSYENRTGELSMAWRKDNKGKALAWFVKRLQQISDDLVGNNYHV